MDGINIKTVVSSKINFILALQASKWKMVEITNYLNDQYNLKTTEKTLKQYISDIKKTVPEIIQQKEIDKQIKQISKAGLSKIKPVKKKKWIRKEDGVVKDNDIHFRANDEIMSKLNKVVEDEKITLSAAITGLLKQHL